MPDRLTHAAPLRQTTRIALLALAAIALLCLATGCERRPAEQSVIQLDRLTRLPEGSSANQPEALRVAVAAVLSPTGTIESYQPLIAHLHRKTGRPVTLVQRKTYQEINDLLARAAVDVGFICTGAYLDGARRQTLELLVVPRINGKTTYRSLIIAPATASIRTFTDLRGKRFAFTDPLSNSGYHYPLSLLQRLGEKPETFFDRTFFTHSHDRSIAAVMDGLADGAAVDSLIFEFVSRRTPAIAKQIAIIDQSSEFGIPPVVVPRSLPASRKEWLKALFLALHKEAEGKTVLAPLGIERFEEPEPARYAP
ncbi:MAG TPA: phosphate/phosphite/phosphonate ABC transporter substrate-binding protein [Desulfurivibrionaceae bacterium]|nr:phosphate/phosphite/phosphonate ABC transporter substrate-binding protein [Desulfurivibrionaceae bacterium]